MPSFFKLLRNTVGFLLHIALACAFGVSWLKIATMICGLIIVVTMLRLMLEGRRQRNERIAWIETRISDERTSRYERQALLEELSSLQQSAWREWLALPLLAVLAGPNVLVIAVVIGPFASCGVASHFTSTYIK